MIDFNNIYLISEQPQTCPKCGTRTDVILDLSHTKNQTQIHECLSVNCKFTFVTEEA
jgi:hypothetical protein